MTSPSKIEQAICLSHKSKLYYPILPIAPTRPMTRRNKANAKGRNTMKIIYMGTPHFAVPALEALAKQHQVVAVLTQPDRPAGRGHKLTPSPVKVAAQALGIPIYQPLNLKLENTRQLRATLKAYQAHIVVVAAYGLLLPKGILNMTPLGAINIHASLLPKYRGASPIHGALLNGDKTAGITIMHMDVGLDTGDMILKSALDVAPGERFESLHHRLAQAGSSLLLEALTALENGTAPRVPQNHPDSTYAPLINKTDAHLNWHWPHHKLINLTRAFDPWPGPYAMYQDAPLKIWTLEMADKIVDEIVDEIASGIKKGPGCLHNKNEEKQPEPGTILAVDPQRGILIKTAEGSLWATELQGMGSKRMAASAFLKGRSIKVGTVLS